MNPIRVPLDVNVNVASKISSLIKGWSNISLFIVRRFNVTLTFHILEP